MPAPNLRHLVHDRRGIAGLYFAMTATCIVLGFLGALDLMRVTMVQSQAQAALDFATLAAGRNLGATTTTWQAEAQAYFDLDMPGGTMGAAVSKPVFNTWTTADGADHLSITLDVQVPLMVTGYAGSVSLNMAAQARKRSRSNVEMVLALDNTGSMLGSKMAAMQSAAQNVVDTMLGKASGGNTFVGLVPFTEEVNLSTYAANWLDPANPPAYPSSQWRGCLRERKVASLYQLDARPPATQRFPAYGVSRLSSTRVWQNGKQVTVQTLENVYADPANFDYQGNCPAAPAMFLSANQTTLKNAVTAMQANGSTMVSSGLVWAWRMLDPGWRGAAGWGDALRPADKANDLVKAVVLLSDGDNDMAGSGTGYTDKSGRSYNDGKYYFYGPFENSRAVPLISAAGWNLTGTRNANADLLLWNSMHSTDSGY
ncbi:MAG TPA: hypothetical protein VL974_08795, partial [Magnetospirillum sp.]|nr:hypothetical protein [Magnetospirillum sp.]